MNFFYVLLGRKRKFQHFGVNQSALLFVVDVRNTIDIEAQSQVQDNNHDMSGIEAQSVVEDCNHGCSSSNNNVTDNCVKSGGKKVNRTAIDELIQ